MIIVRHKLRRAATLAGFVLTLANVGRICTAGTETDPAVSSGALDAAPYGFIEVDSKSFGVRWGEPRKIRQVAVGFAEGGRLPEPDKVRVQYWHGSWDGRPDPILAEHGAGRVGWAKMDDWTNGRWKDADTSVRTEGQRWIFTFEPTGAGEFEMPGHPGVTYRKTLKIRIAAEEPLPKPVRFQAFTDAVCRPLTVRIYWGPPAEPRIRIDGDDAGGIEVYNGTVAALRPIRGKVVVTPDHQWALPAGEEGGIEADLIMAVDPTDYNSRYDRTIVTVRSKYRPFSFAAAEAARGERILVDDLGALVVRGDDPVTLAGLREMRKESPGKTVYDRVLDVPEQTLARAWGDMPLKRPLYYVHGLPGNRNVMHQQLNGDVSISASKRWFNLPKSPRDSERKQWDGEWMALRFGFPPDHLCGGRELREGYLPLLRTWWQDGPIHYEQSTIMDSLEGNLSALALDDPTVLLMRIRMVNTSSADKGTAGLHVRSGQPDGETLFLENGRVMARWRDQLRLRCVLIGVDRGTTADKSAGLGWSLPLGPGESHDLYVIIPSVTLDKEEEIETLRKRDFEKDAARICDFWRDLTTQGTKITTPAPWINDFYKAHVRHLMVNCQKEIGSARLHAHVGTAVYGAYANESAMMIRDLDLRGHHNEAERCLESFLHYQGTVPLPGNYRTTEGLFYGAGGHETGGYNKNHGWVMYNMADHWWMTRDRRWMDRAAPKLVQACEWIIRERQATLKDNPDGTRPIEYGCLPAGSLEDVRDYWYWMVTNACTAWGFDALAAALADYGHPEAVRLQREAEAFHADVVRAVEESRIRTPVVKLRDGTYVPKYPSHLHERGRCYGWLRETLEGSIHLLITGLIAPDAPQAAWILKDYEDNLYISDTYGYSIPAFDAFWFSRGGFSMQANLLGGPLPYLYRDEIKHYLRAYFNGFASAFYPETRMCNEHSLPELGYPTGDHFKSSDEAQSTYWLRLMFIREVGDDIFLGQAIPRDWLQDGRTAGIDRAPSRFGPLSVRFESRAANGEIKVTVVPPDRNRPKSIFIRIRHPLGKPIHGVTVNGKAYDHFDAAKEWIFLPGSIQGVHEIVARYAAADR
ncbi:MAG TPA: hypothetical protein VLM89_12725 [Phycisphaerae bacterium]|nr:hypothetical protein [Phycisphaerae bacterium]